MEFGSVVKKMREKKKMSEHELAQKVKLYANDIYITNILLFITIRTHVEEFLKRFSDDNKDIDIDKGMKNYAGDMIGDNLIKYIENGDVFPGIKLTELILKVLDVSYEELLSELESDENNLE